MKNLLIGIIYTVVIAGVLAHFSGCEAPDLHTVTDLILTPAAEASTPTPSPVPEATEGAGQESGEVQKNETTTEKTDEPENKADVTPEVSSFAGIGIVAVDDVIWTTGSLNVRKGPGTDYEKLGVLASNSKVHRTGLCENGWQRIEYKDGVAFISGKYVSSTEPVTSKTPTPTLVPDPDKKAENDPAKGTPTSVPSADDQDPATPGSSLTDTIDNVDIVLASITPVGNEVSLEAASSFYYDTEEKATAAFLKYANGYTTFTILYKDKECMHTPAYFLYTYPELNSVEINFSKSRKYLNGIYVVYNVDLKRGGQFAYAIRTGDTSILDEKELTALKKVEALSKELGLENLSDIETVKTVHDYLINNTRYADAVGIGSNGAKKYADEDHSPYGLLTNKTAVCDGYAVTFMMFMLMNDIDCKTVIGYAGDPGEVPENHAWNQVFIAGEWYNVDVTWDDPVLTDSVTKERVDVLNYTYFMINDAILSITHTSTCSYCEECTSDAYLMYPYEEYLCLSEKEIKESIERQLNANEDVVTLIYKSTDFNKSDIVDYFQDLHNVTFRLRPEVEVREGYKKIEIFNPFK